MYSLSLLFSLYFVSSILLYRNFYSLRRILFLFSMLFPGHFPSPPSINNVSSLKHMLSSGSASLTCLHTYWDLSYFSSLPEHVSSKFTAFHLTTATSKVFHPKSDSLLLNFIINNLSSTPFYLLISLGLVIISDSTTTQIFILGVLCSYTDCHLSSLWFI